jgi:hypothetical protein
MLVKDEQRTFGPPSFASSADKRLYGLSRSNLDMTRQELASDTYETKTS